ncbi:MAG TPA: hypothetical protein EYQ21_00070 [Flavobacteriales bacterium]|nr:hypothetical protein [Flavobacteriales bacterium]
MNYRDYMIDDAYDITTYGVSSEAGAVFHDHIDNHQEMLSECIAFNDWVQVEEGYEFWTPSLIKYHIDALVKNDMPRKSSPDKPWDRWFAVPSEHDMPAIYKFVEDNKHQYKDVLISKLAAGAQIAPHTHSRQKFIYNMSINSPEGCTFTVYPTGPIPYKAGDIYKVHTRHTHSVKNDSNEDRYHIMLMSVADMSQFQPKGKIRLT